MSKVLLTNFIHFLIKMFLLVSKIGQCIVLRGVRRVSSSKCSCSMLLACCGVVFDIFLLTNFIHFFVTNLVLIRNIFLSVFDIFLQKCLPQCLHSFPHQNVLSTLLKGYILKVNTYLNLVKICCLILHHHQSY